MRLHPYLRVRLHRYLRILRGLLAALIVYTAVLLLSPTRDAFIICAIWFVLVAPLFGIAQIRRLIIGQPRG
jgi:hypothetical protein